MSDVGPYEASIIARAAQLKRTFYGVPKPTVVRLLPKAQDTPVAIQPQPMTQPAKRLATTSARALVVEVAKKHQLNWRELVGSSRSQIVVRARNEAAFRLITEMGQSYNRAGRVLGDKDHTTILHACRRYAETSAEAAEIWRKHVECETGARANKREKAIALHFDKGLTHGQIAARLHVMPGVVKGWLEEFHPLSPQLTEGCANSRY
jgi:hypothetical protein